MAAVRASRGATTESRPREALAVTGTGVVPARETDMRGTGRRMDRSTVASEGPAAVSTPPETAKRVTGRVCATSVVFCVGLTRTWLTFTFAKRLVGTKTYAAGSTLTGDPT
jgi:hypothetical protein